MLTIRSSLTGLPLRAKTLADVAGRVVTATLVKTIEVEPGNTQTVIDRDITTTTVTGGRWYNATQFTVTTTAGIKPTFRTTTPGVVAVSPEGLVTKVADGQGIVFVTTAGVTTRHVVQIKTENIPAKITHKYNVGTLGYALSKSIDDAIAGRDPAVAKARFTTQNHVTGSYVNNPNQFLTATGHFANVLSGVCVLRSGSVAKLGHLVECAYKGTTPLRSIVIGCAHSLASVGDVLRFVDATGAVHEREIIRRQIHPDYNNPPLANDLCLYQIRTDLPTTIRPIKFIDWTAFQQKLVIANATKGAAAVLTLHQNGLVGVNSVSSINNGALNTTSNGAFPDRVAFNEHVVVGDSGNCGLFLLNGQPHFGTVWTIPSGGSNIMNYIPWIRTAAAAMNGIPMSDITIQPTDLSAFPSFAP